MDSSAPTQSPQTTRKQTPAEIRRSGKNERKNAAREALRRQEAARRQRNAWLGAFGALIVVVGGVFLLTQLGSKAKPKAAASPTAAAAPGPQAAPSTPPSAAAAPTPSGPPFPGVAAGENAGLKTQPTPKAGTGTVSKLVVTTLIQGTGPVVKSGDNITVNYIGATYKDGKVFDSSWSRKQTFAITNIGQAQLIEGWNKGLVGVKVGSRVQLDIPQAQAYPTATAGSGQPVGDLRFIVDVLSIDPK